MTERQAPTVSLLRCIQITEDDVGLGRPQKCDVMLEGDTAKLSEDKSKNEFIVAFAKEELVAVKVGGRA